MLTPNFCSYHVEGQITVWELKPGCTLYFELYLHYTLSQLSVYLASLPRLRVSPMSGSLLNALAQRPEHTC